MTLGSVTLAGGDLRRATLSGAALGVGESAALGVGESAALPGGRGASSGLSSNLLIGSIVTGVGPRGATEVAICGIDNDNPDLPRYTLQSYREDLRSWENPCFGDNRALVLSGTWDSSGGRHDSETEFTFACDEGVIAKCVRWGYHVWQSQGPTSLAAYHQACTRMARADYCGNGKPHTKDNTVIDVYDNLGIQNPTVAKVIGDTRRMSFEAAWTPDGAYCLSRTRNGQALDEVLSECPGRFVKGSPEDLGRGAACSLQIQNGDKSAILLRNRSFPTL